MTTSATRSRLLKTSCLFAALALLGLLVCPGCRKPLAEVRGKVSLNGTPSKGIFVQFACKDKGIFMSAPVTPEGTFRVSMARGYGLPPDTTYQMCVSFPPDYRPPGNNRKETEEAMNKIIPSRYRSFQTSNLTLDLKPGGADLDIVMKD